MTSRHDWTPLAHHDALPGDPAGVTATARRLRTLADGLQRQARVVRDVDPGPAWVGLAALRFEAARDRLPRGLVDAARRLGTAAGALERWAAVVADTQAAGLRARDEARAAEVDIAAAERGIAAIRAHHASERRLADAWNRANPDGPRRRPRGWHGPDWGARLTDAEGRLAAARRDFAAAVADHRAGGAHAAGALAAADRFLDDPPWALGALPRILAAGARLMGPDEVPFVVTPAGLALNTAEGWRHETYRQAGIDPAAWDPSLGLAPLDGTAVAAWEFYADLYERDPDRFLWAGMATLAGGTFYAAFQDLHVLRVALERGTVTADEAIDILERSFPAGVATDRITHVLVDATAGELARELRYVETTFLQMQRDIFDDLAWQHVAYDAGGIESIRALREAGEVQAVHLRGWEAIDAGDVTGGNRLLLHHEQHTVIGDSYDRIRDRSPITWSLTMGMSVLAHSPVPGGQPFRDVVPYRVEIDVPDRIPVVPDRLVPDRIPFTDVRVPGGGGVYVVTPERVVLAELPLHNVSIFQHRWTWISEDMLPAWLGHVDAGTAGPLVSEPLADQAARQRIVPDRLLPYEPE